MNDCVVINKSKEGVNKIWDTNEIFVELPPHLEYLCLCNIEYFPSIVLSSLPERDKTLLLQILEKNNLGIMYDQDMIQTTALRLRERDSSDAYIDTK